MVEIKVYHPPNDWEVKEAEELEEDCTIICEEPEEIVGDLIIKGHDTKEDGEVTEEVYEIGVNNTGYVVYYGGPPLEYIKNAESLVEYMENTEDSMRYEIVAEEVDSDIIANYI
jgi:hypothetical protein